MRKDGLPFIRDKKGNVTAIKIIFNKEDILPLFNTYYRRHIDECNDIVECDECMPIVSPLTDDEISKILINLWESMDEQYRITYESLHYFMNETINGRKSTCKL